MSYRILIAGLLAWPRRRKQMAMLVADVLSIQVTLWLARALRLDTFAALQGDAIMLLLLESRELVRRRCVQRAREMSWDTCSEEFLDLYMSLSSRTLGAAA